MPAIHLGAVTLSPFAAGNIATALPVLVGGALMSDADDVMLMIRRRMSKIGRPRDGREQRAGGRRDDGDKSKI